MLDSPVLPVAAGLLADSWRRVADCAPALDVTVLTAARPTAPAGWLPLIGSAEQVGRAIAGEADRIRVAHGCEPPLPVAASRLLHHYLWSLGVLAGGPWYLERRVPRLRPELLRTDPATGALAVRPSGFACLPDDPAAGRPGVRVLPGEAALQAELRSAVAESAEPLLAAFRPVLCRGPRALWGMVADDLASALWYLGRMRGEEERAVAAATAVLPGGTPPFPGAADFRRLPGTRGGTHLTRTRLGCCLYYAIRPADACLTCPRTTDAERVRRLEAAGS
ncbi:(2Fe-2S)-binding protein [Kitasatospora sp. NPDC052896]|uniref:(2Fe-2S)-binding protein n=1 Tax=Kitasatospora sp. NPDC052896 TaxID=3364061 RepID=UPI0037C5D1ED